MNRALKKLPVKGSRKLSILLTAVWCFFGLLLFAVFNVLRGLGRAFAGFAVQRTDSAYDRFVDHVFAVFCLPDRILPLPTSTSGNVVHIAAAFVWTFLLCLVLSAVYHTARCDRIQPQTPTSPNGRSA